MIKCKVSSNNVPPSGDIQFEISPTIPFPYSTLSFENKHLVFKLSSTLKNIATFKDIHCNFNSYFNFMQLTYGALIVASIA